MFQELAAMEHSCAVINNASHLLVVVMGFDTVLMMRLDVVSYAIIERYNNCYNCMLVFDRTVDLLLFYEICHHTYFSYLQKWSIPVQ